MQWNSLNPVLFENNKSQHVSLNASSGLIQIRNYVSFEIVQICKCDTYHNFENLDIRI